MEREIKIMVRMGARPSGQRWVQAGGELLYSGPRESADPRPATLALPWWASNGPLRQWLPTAEYSDRDIQDGSPGLNSTGDTMPPRWAGLALWAAAEVAEEEVGDESAFFYGKRRRRDIEDAAATLVARHEWEEWRAATLAAS